MLSMKKIGAVLLAIFLVAGYATAAHGPESHAGDSGTGPVSDTPNAGKTAGPPEYTGKPEDIGPEQRKKGIQNAITRVPRQVADNVLTPIQNIEPGKALGDALQGIGQFFQMPRQDLNQSLNNSGNASQ
jgi:hypothetical protein